MKCLIQDLRLNVHSYLDIFLHGSGSSFDNHWRHNTTNYWIEMEIDLLKWTGTTLKRIEGS